MQRAATLIGKLKLPEGADGLEQRAKAAWRVAAGKKVERHSVATRLVRGTLVVEVEDMLWQRQLNTLRGALLGNLAKVLGPGVVTGLDFRPAPPRRGPQWASSARPPASAAEGAAGDEASAIGDPVMALLYRRSVKRARSRTKNAASAQLRLG